jgi:DNA adenine methylase
MTLWEQIIDQPNRLADRYEWLWHAQRGRERRFYDLVRERFNRTHRPYYFLYLLARCVKASVRYNADGNFNQSPDNRRKGRQPEAMRRDILGASGLLKYRTTLLSTDYREVLQGVTPNDLIYLDPPYQGVCATRDPRYIMSIESEEFIATLAKLNRDNISYIVSYDGRTGQKSFGAKLPESLRLIHIEVDAGRSSQATLLGRRDKTFESLYLSPALVERIYLREDLRSPVQLSLFGEPF